MAAPAAMVGRSRAGHGPARDRTGRRALAGERKGWRARARAGVATVASTPASRRLGDELPDVPLGGGQLDLGGLAFQGDMGGGFGAPGGAGHGGNKMLDRGINTAIVLGASTYALTKLLTVDQDYWHIDLMADPSNVDLSARSKKGKYSSVHEDKVLTDAFEGALKKQKRVSNIIVNASTFEEDEATDANIEICISETRPIGRKEVKALQAKLLHKWPTVLRKRK